MILQLLHLYLALAFWESIVYFVFWSSGKMNATDKEQMREWMFFPKWFVFVTTPVLIIELPILLYFNLL